MIAGAAGGLAGAWAMSRAHTAISKLREQKQPASKPKEESEDATMKAADKVLSIATGRHLTHEQKQAAGPVVHYAFGAAMGAIYGAVTEHRRHLTPAAGPIFGSALFAGADEMGVPLARLSGPPTDYPISTHLEAWVAHLVYGVAADLVRRGVRAAL